MSASSSPAPYRRWPRPGRSGTAGHPPDNARFPPLVDDPNGILALPPGFSYEIVTYAGRTELNVGQGPTPSNHDGTAVFNARRGRLRLIQNHELPRRLAARRAARRRARCTTRPRCMAGGCTVIDTDRRGRNHGEWVGISGTLGNCAGGPTPWGTWLTCEET